MGPFGSLFELFADNKVVAYFVLLAIAFVTGVGYSFAYKLTKKGEVYTKFVPVAMIILPAVMTFMIGLINLRNFEMEAGATAIRVGLVVSCGIALTRFRSNGLPMMDMVYVIIATSTGLILSVGYALFAIITAIIFIAILLILHKVDYGENHEGIYTLKYEVGEDLNDNAVFEEAIAKHCDSFKIISVKTVEYGQLFEMRYGVKLKKGHTAKELIDEVRLHNANLNVTLCISEKER